MMIAARRKVDVLREMVLLWIVAEVMTHRRHEKALIVLAQQTEIPVALRRRMTSDSVFERPMKTKMVNCQKKKHRND